MTSLSVRLDRAHFAFGERVLLRDASVHLVSGWTAVAGPNGAGKSTLLRILAGELSPGAAKVQPTAAMVLRLSQQLTVPDPIVSSFSEEWTARAMRLRARLALDVGMIYRWETLSPGERRRWQIAAALWREPDVLLLDEPDNHLDAATRELLLRELVAFRGIGVVVSHDRAFLDALVQRTVWLEDGELSTFEGHLSFALAEQERRRVRALDEASRIDAAHRRATRQLRETSSRHQATARSKSLRGLNPRDHDARSSGRKARVAKAEAAHARALQRARRSERDASEARSGVDRSKELGSAVRIASVPPDSPSLFSPFEGALDLGFGDRLWLRGPNGSGKSTLLRQMVAHCVLPRERVLYLPQELGDAAVRELLSRVRALHPEARGRVMQLSAAMGLSPSTVLSADGMLSPGEGRKLALADGLGRGATLVVLDEPENHLDLPARQRLESALRCFDGALLLVTHDEVLGRALGARSMEMSAASSARDAPPRPEPSPSDGRSGE